MKHHEPWLFSKGTRPHAKAQHVFAGRSAAAIKPHLEQRNVSEQALDAAIEETFPASDPISVIVTKVVKHAPGKAPEFPTMQGPPMEPTTPGMNQTGAALKPQCLQAMRDAVQHLSPPTDIDASAVQRERLLYLNDSEAIGSVPRPATFSGTVKTSVARLMGERPELLVDKIGERIAFERGGVRLYDALIVKHQAAAAAGAQLPPIARALQKLGDAPAWIASARDETPAQTLARIRAEELAHFHMLCDAMQQLGGDPTAQTPCADVIGTASIGLLQVVTDPRTTLAQSLNAMLTVELTDNAGWELLLQLADKAGETQLSDRFLHAITQETQHLVVIRSWLTVLLMAEDPSLAI